MSGCAGPVADTYTTVQQARLDAKRSLSASILQLPPMPVFRARPMHTIYLYHSRPSAHRKKRVRPPGSRAEMTAWLCCVVNTALAPRTFHPHSGTSAPGTTILTPHKRSLTPASSLAPSHLTCSRCLDPGQTYASRTLPRHLCRPPPSHWNHFSPVLNPVVAAR